MLCQWKAPIGRSWLRRGLLERQVRQGRRAQPEQLERLGHKVRLELQVRLVLQVQRERRERKEIQGTLEQRERLGLKVLVWSLRVRGMLARRTMPWTL